MPSPYKLPLILDPQPEGGCTLTCPQLPELVTEGDTVEEALGNLRDALQAVLEIYEEQGRPLPVDLVKDPENAPIRFEYVVKAA